ncbi:MAG: lipid II flippase MurJ [Desulfobacteraceae bacterium]|jgi:peptidoglycan biosynthesis protein MviN/MurJ (putative lipid II flippase)
MALKTIQAVSVATISNLTGRAANVALPLAIIAIYGADSQTDLFFLVMALGFFCYGTLANAITESTVPALISSRRRLPPLNVLKYAGAITFIILVLGCIWQWSFKQFNIIYAVALALMVGAGIANGVFSGVLYVQERYAPAGFTWALRFVPLIALVTLNPHPDPLPWLALGIGAMDWLRCAILIRCSRASRTKGEAIDIKLFINRYRTTYGTVLVAMLIMGFNPLVDRLIAQLNGPGGISILDASDRLYGILATLCTMGLMTVLLTRFSKEASEGRLESGWHRVLKMIALWCLAWMIAGVVAGCWGLDWWLSKGTVLRPDQCAAVKQAYWYYLIGLPLFTLGVVYVKRLQALHRTTILVWIAVLAVVLNLITSLILRMALGIPGIALATSLVYAVTAIALITAAHRIPIEKQQNKSP